MKRITIGLLLVLLLLGSNTGTAQYSGTFSDKLSDTKYGWKITKATGDTGDFSKGDTVELEFSESPGGLTYTEFLDLGVKIRANGDKLDMNKDASEYSDIETIALLFILVWAVTDPSTTLTEENGYTIDGNEATSDTDDTYSTESGILLVSVFSSTDGSGSFTFEYQEGGLSFLPVSPLFILLGLIALPILNRKRVRFQ